MRKDRMPIKDGDESDWTTKWRRVLCVFKNRTGLGRKVKRRLNKRVRHKIKEELSNETET